MLVVTVIVNVCCSVLEVYRNRNQEMKKVLLGFVGFSICGVIALVIYWNSPTMNYAVVYCAGLTIFLMFVLWAAYERLYLVLGHNAQVMAYKELAYKDVMTNLGNRAAFMSDSKQLERAHSPGVIVLDVNNLKTVNDCYGHQEGDLMICNASECIARAFEGKGTAYRIGGDEFVILLEKTTEAHIKQLLIRLDDVLEKKQQELKKPWQLRIARGYAVRHGKISMEELFNQADDRMYECKRQMKEKIKEKEKEKIEKTE